MNTILPFCLAAVMAFGYDLAEGRRHSLRVNIAGCALFAVAALGLSALLVNAVLPTAWRFIP